MGTFPLVLWLAGLVLPPLITVFTAVRLRGISILGGLLGAAFTGYVLMCWSSIAVDQAHYAAHPEDTTRCGMGTGLMILYGWVLCAGYVACWAAASYTGIGTIKFVKYIHLRKCKPSV